MTTMPPDAMRFDYPVFERRRDGYLVSSDRRLLDLDAVHRMLATSYWAAGIPRDVVVQAIAGSMAYGLYEEGDRSGASDDRPPSLRQLGFARTITDGATFAYLADVWVEPGMRGRGLGRLLVETMLDHPGLQTLRRWMLVTRDAHGLYTPLGFAATDVPGNVLVRRGRVDYGSHPGQAAPGAAEG